MSPELYHVRQALLSDVPALHDLIEVSSRTLQSDDYSTEQIRLALGSILGVDTQLIEDGTYFVVEAEGTIIACGGWSFRKTLFGADPAPGRLPDRLNPATDAARIRAFFVHPAWARHGIATRILQACEQAVAAAGFHMVELGATLTGEGLYLRNGYHVVERIAVPLANAESFPVVRMRKSLAP